MKSNHGITITSLIVYVIILLISVGVISGFVGYFYHNTDETIVSTNSADQHVKFLTYMSENINMREY